VTNITNREVIGGSINGQRAANALPNIRY
jgi:hypothetical protein